MIQDIQPHQFDNQYRPCPPDAQSYALYYEGQSALLKKRKDGIEFPRFRDLERLNEEIYEEAVYLFTIDEERFYLVQNISRERLSEFTMENKESFRYAEPQYLAFAGITGYQLNNWYRNRKFCGRCGHKMRHDEKERMMRCDHCGNMEFPKICPAVIPIPAGSTPTGAAVRTRSACLPARARRNGPTAASTIFPSVSRRRACPRLSTA